MCFENLICLTTQLVEFELRGKFVNGEVIWSKISTLKLYGSYEQQLGRKTSPSAHVLYFHFLCYPLPLPPRGLLVRVMFMGPGIIRGYLNQSTNTLFHWSSSQ